MYTKYMYGQWYTFIVCMIDLLCIHLTCAISIIFLHYFLVSVAAIMWLAPRKHAVSVHNY